MKFILSTLICLVSISAFAQINLQDSSVQVIGYWSKKDAQTYNIIDSKYKIHGSDTSGMERIKYQVEVTVIDSTAKSYTIQWFYKNFDITGSNDFAKSIASIFKDVKVVIKTDEMGAFIEVVNWKEVRDEVNKAFAVVKKQFKGNKEMEAVLNNVNAQLTTKESIESTAIQDIKQFYTFHGARYTLNEDLESKLVSNGIPEVPVNVLMTVRLAEINVDEGNAVLRYWREFDRKQMTDASYFMMQKLAKSSGVKMPTRAEMSEVAYDESVGTRIHCSSGWVIYSIQTKQTVTGDDTSIEQREIEIL